MTYDPRMGYDPARKLTDGDVQERKGWSEGRYARLGLPADGWPTVSVCGTTPWSASSAWLACWSARGCWGWLLWVMRQP